MTDFTFNDDTIKQVFQTIDSEEKLNHFLEQSQNPYCKFILQKQALPKPETGRVEMHHIIPLHAGGPKYDRWNLLLLSFDDHTHAHFLLSQDYQSRLDKYAYTWRAGFTSEARRLQREYANTKSVFFDSTMQSKFGSIWSPKREETYIKNQTVFTQKAFENGMIWYHQRQNILIRVSPEVQVKRVYKLAAYFKKVIAYIVSDDKRELAVFAASLSRVINGKSGCTYNGFFLVGIITNPFVTVNFNLRPFYKDTPKRFFGFKEKFATEKEMRQNLGKSLGKRSFSFELVQNLKFTTVWYYKKNNLTVEIEPCQGVKELVEKLETCIHVTYTDQEKKQFSALIKNKWVGKTRKGWTLVKIKDQE